MTSSDWLQIALFLLAALIGGATSWGFYRAQQKTDYNHLRDAIRDVESEMKLLRERMTTLFVVDQSLENIKEKLDLQKEIKDVARQVQEQQTRPFKKLYEDVEDKTSELINGLEKSIKEEIHRTMPASAERDELIKQLVGKVDASAQKIDELQTNLLNEQSSLIIESSGLIARNMLDLMLREIERSRTLNSSAPIAGEPFQVIESNLHHRQLEVQADVITSAS